MTMALQKARTKMYVKINVTTRDIKSGARKHSGNCPIALAVKRLIKPTYRTSVNVNNDGDIQVHAPVASYGKALRKDVKERNFHYKNARMPVKAQRFISMYDSAISVEPFSFWANIPTAVLRKQRA